MNMPLQTDPPMVFVFEPSKAQEAQAFTNHGQTLERLATRGGMSLSEMLSIVEVRRWKHVGDTEALCRLVLYGLVGVAPTP